MLLCYGRHTNLGLLEHYGFVLENNPHDVADLPASAFPALVQSQLEAAGVTPSVHSDGNPSWDLLRALRLASLTPQERSTSAYLALRDERVCDRSERWALEAQRAGCAAALARLPPSLQHDKELRQNGGLAPGMEVAVRWRVGYKRAVQAAVAGCEQALADLAG